MWINLMVKNIQVCLLKLREDERQRWTLLSTIALITGDWWKKNTCSFACFDNQGKQNYLL